MAEVNNKPLVSVIIPVFNCEQWVERSIKSVQDQKYNNIEVIVVDDGSKDSSGLLCDRMSEKDRRVKVIHQPNGGVNAARRKGVEMAVGDWLIFVDADDTIDEDCISHYLSLVNKKSDIVATGKENEILSWDKYCLKLLSGEIRPGLVEKLFSTDLFKKHEVALERELVMGEDLILNLAVGKYARCIISTDKALYKVNKDNPASATNSFKKSWRYEKYYFSNLFRFFMDGLEESPSYNDLLLLVRKSQLNGIKYLMLDGNKVDYNDEEFKELQSYYKSKKNMFVMSERLIFQLKNPLVYKTILNTYLHLKHKNK